MTISCDILKSKIAEAVPGAQVEVVSNDSPSAQHSLAIDRDHALAAALFLRDDPEFRFDYCSNATGVDWPEKEISEKIKTKKVVDGVEKELEEVRKTVRPGFLEAVYHLYSMEKRHGPVILRVRTANRSDDARLPSLTPAWRSCEFQEREIFDLYGIRFDGHPDLRRILMWEGFLDFPMRRDYADPDDYEYEPTPHDDVLERAKAHYAQSAEPPAAAPADKK